MIVLAITFKGYGAQLLLRYYLNQWALVQSFRGAQYLAYAFQILLQPIVAA